MKKIVVPVLIVLLAFNILSGCGLKELFVTNEYGSEYVTYWKSTDGHFELINNNRMGMRGDGTFDGMYFVNENSYPVSITIDKGPDFSYTDARFDTMTLEFIYSGKGVYDSSTNRFTIDVEEVDNDLSVYKPGDTIVFYQVE